MSNDRVIQMPAARDAEGVAYDREVIDGQAKLILRLRRSNQNLACATCAGWGSVVLLLTYRAVTWFVNQ